jgi:hypothetical protein
MSIDTSRLLVVIAVGAAAGCVGAASDRTSVVGYLIAGIVGAYGAIYTTRIELP